MIKYQCLATKSFLFYWKFSLLSRQFYKKYKRLLRYVSASSCPRYQMQIFKLYVLNIY